MRLFFEFTLCAALGLLFPGPSAAWLQRAERLRRQQASAGLGVRRGWPASTGAG
ncbi:hypothetical protein [Pseudomonas aeruginosa]|uniref:hypothetical protein n=1 Tax=Pseudomonas aeruginosa TaxID=287 RepID=UPI0016031FE2|nr:hypothetical protein [Pseudomonas aeruginosa]